MKLILTEEQLNLLLQTEGVARLLQESLGDSKNLENLKINIINSVITMYKRISLAQRALRNLQILNTGITLLLPKNFCGTISKRLLGS